MRDRLHRSLDGVSAGQPQERAPGRATLTRGIVARSPSARATRHGPSAPEPSAAVEAAAASSGSPLPVELGARLEAGLGADLGAVRVHTGGESAAAARALGANAYALGNDIHFGDGRYDPGSRDGQHLIAHEVAHTVQQAGVAATPQCDLEVSGPGDASEREADAFADAFVVGAASTWRASDSSDRSRPLIQRAAIEMEPEIIGASETELEMEPEFIDATDDAPTVDLRGGNVRLENFSQGSAALRESHRAALDELRTRLRQRAVDAGGAADDWWRSVRVVRGFASPEGTEQRNASLSKQRAATVIEALFAGADATVARVEAHGEMHEGQGAPRRDWPRYRAVEVICGAPPARAVTTPADPRAEAAAPDGVEVAPDQHRFPDASGLVPERPGFDAASVVKSAAVDLVAEFAPAMVGAVLFPFQMLQLFWDMGNAWAEALRTNQRMVFPKGYAYALTSRFAGRDLSELTFPERWNARAAVGLDRYAVQRLESLHRDRVEGWHDGIAAGNRAYVAHQGSYLVTLERIRTATAQQSSPTGSAPAAPEIDPAAAERFLNEIHRGIAAAELCGSPTRAALQASRVHLEWPGPRWQRDDDAAAVVCDE
jgi:outer membrane protein OmpA-like peptidoglycan-associated protein